MIIDCISDLHGFKPHLEGGDLLIVAGDMTARDTVEQHKSFREWLQKQDYRNKIMIAGNHDGYYEELYGDCNMVLDNQGTITYLQDSAVVVDGLKIYGSPWTPTFFDWHFMKDRGEPLKERWDLIPEGVNILVTHGPPFGILDRAGEKCGCEDLLEAVKRVKPRLHVFGHIHESHGSLEQDGTLFCNLSIMDKKYKPTNHVTRIIWDDKAVRKQ